MKKIIIFACEKDSNKIFKYVTKDCKNSLIFYNKKANEFFFKQKSNQKIEKIEIVISKISFDEELIENIKYILKKSYEKIKEITSDFIGPFDEKEIYSEIYSYISHCYYDSRGIKFLLTFII